MAGRGGASAAADGRRVGPQRRPSGGERAGGAPPKRDGDGIGQAPPRVRADEGTDATIKLAARRHQGVCIEFRAIKDGFEVLDRSDKPSITVNGLATDRCLLGSDTVVAIGDLARQQHDFRDAFELRFLPGNATTSAPSDTDPSQTPLEPEPVPVPVPVPVPDSTAPLAEPDAITPLVPRRVPATLSTMTTGLGLGLDDDAATEPLPPLALRPATLPSPLPPAAPGPDAATAGPNGTIRLAPGALLPPVELEPAAAPPRSAGHGHGHGHEPGTSRNDETAEHDEVPLRPAVPTWLVPALAALAVAGAILAAWFLWLRPAPAEGPTVVRPGASATTTAPERTAAPSAPAPVETAVPSAPTLVPSASAPSRPTAPTRSAAPRATQATPPVKSPREPGEHDGGSDDDAQMALRRRLEAKANAGKASREELRRLLSLCLRQQDATCVAQTQARISNRPEEP